MTQASLATAYVIILIIYVEAGQHMYTEAILALVGTNDGDLCSVRHPTGCSSNSNQLKQVSLKFTCTFDLYSA